MSAPPPPPPPASGEASTKSYKEQQAEAANKLEDKLAVAADFATQPGHALNAEEKHVINDKGTERAGTGKYTKFFPGEGYFACRNCGLAIYSFTAKFESGCGWPAFDKCYEGSITAKKETDGSDRVEITCSGCEGHLGHIFLGERGADSQRHCVNSMSLQFVKGKQVDKKEMQLNVGAAE